MVSSCENLCSFMLPFVYMDACLPCRYVTQCSMQIVIEYYARVIRAIVNEHEMHSKSDSPFQ